MPTNRGSANPLRHAIVRIAQQIPGQSGKKRKHETRRQVEEVFCNFRIGTTKFTTANKMVLR